MKLASSRIPNAYVRTQPSPGHGRFFVQYANACSRQLSRWNVISMCLLGRCSFAGYIALRLGGYHNCHSTPVSDVRRYTLFGCATLTHSVHCPSGLWSPGRCCRISVASTSKVLGGRCMRCDDVVGVLWSSLPLRMEDRCLIPLQSGVRHQHWATRISHNRYYLCVFTSS